MFFTLLLSKGQLNLHELDLAPGSYAMRCFMPDPGGTPHVMLGMVEIVVVEETTCLIGIHCGCQGAPLDVRGADSCGTSSGAGNERVVHEVGGRVTTETLVEDRESRRHEAAACRRPEP